MIFNYIHLIYLIFQGRKITVQEWYTKTLQYKQIKYMIMYISFSIYLNVYRIFKININIAKNKINNIINNYDG